MRVRTMRWAAALAAVAAVALVAACGGGDDGGAEGPRIVVTTPVLASVVREVVGDRASVEALMPNGADPHDYSPSAREIARLQDADLVVENGLGLEEGLRTALDQARAAGVPVFTVTDHVRLRAAGARGDEHGPDDDHDAGDEHGHDEGDGHGHDDEGAHAEEEGHAHEGDDPHVWMDPIAMRDAVRALAPRVADELGVDVADGAAATARRLEALDARVRDTLAAIPAGDRRIVSGHESMGYFADRYDLEIAGVLLPSLSSQAEASAANLAELRARIQREGVRVIFDETGTPPGVADAIARETDARVVEIATHTLPDDGSYATFITGVARTVADAHAGA